MSDVILKTVSSLEKIQKYTPPQVEEKVGVCFKNARYNFQLAFCSKKQIHGCELCVEGSLAKYVTLRIVEDVAVKFTYDYQARPEDTFVLGRQAGMYPDILREPTIFSFACFPEQWNSVWITVTGEEGLPVGEHVLAFTLKSGDGILGEARYTLKVFDAELPKLSIFNTNWFHYDCLSEWYKTEVFGKDYYTILNRYIKNMVNHGVNTIFTPLFTPPLDTAVNAERKTTQLIDIFLKDGQYIFDFSKLSTFIDNALSLGIEKIEFSHLFTQWGGLYCPKIMATVNGEYKKIFGWETESESQEYIEFLQAFLPRLMEFIEEKKIKECCYFHIFDEPQEKDLEKYASLRGRVKALIGDIPVIDALSDIRFSSLVDIPVVDVKCIENYVGNCECFGGYYFCSTGNNATNRFIVHPALRTRIVGYQTYLHNLAGFLHWGHNFWKTQLSKENINPYLVNDAGGAFAAGDAFTVYPGEDGPIDSIRHEIISDGWNDYRELLFIEKQVGREAIMAVFDKCGMKGMYEYPFNIDEYILLKKELLSLIGIAE